MALLRLLRQDDAAELADVFARNRSFLQPWDPDRDDAFFTEQGQALVIADTLAGHATGSALPLVILDGEEIVGRIGLNAIVRLSFQSAVVGYWVAEDRNGRGFATRAVAELKELAFGELGLHRLEAGTLVHNVRSQRVLEKNGFVRFGLAPQYLRIADEWQDHILFQVLADTPRT